MMNYKLILLIINCMFLNKVVGMGITTQDVQSYLDEVTVKFNANKDSLDSWFIRIYSRQINAYQDDLLHERISNKYMYDQIDQLNMNLDTSIKSVLMQQRSKRLIDSLDKLIISANDQRSQMKKNLSDLSHYSRENNRAREKSDIVENKSAIARLFDSKLKILSAFLSPICLSTCIYCYYKIPSEMWYKPYVIGLNCMGAITSFTSLAYKIYCLKHK